MPKITRASTALTHARDQISQGWCKGDFKIPRGERDTIEGRRSLRHDRYCALGAVRLACGFYNGYLNQLYGDWNNTLKLKRKCDRHLESALTALTARKGKIGRIALRHADYGLGDPNVAGFNDDAETKRPMVLALFDVAIDRARKDEQRARQRASRANRKAAV
jgi:hypothetical protein